MWPFSRKNAMPPSRGPALGADFDLSLGPHDDVVADRQDGPSGIPPTYFADQLVDPTWQQDLADQCLEQALNEQYEREELLGTLVPSGERLTRASARARELVDQQFARRDSAMTRASLMEAEERTRRAIEAMQQTFEANSAVFVLKEFWKNHPFLAGVLGAEVYSKVKSRLDRS